MVSEIGEFLRSRRARVTPAQAGLHPDLRRRRVPGLRREEVAQAAGVSVDYYVHIEQGRTSHVSNAVLDAISRALQLTDAEREHLSNLTRRPARPKRAQRQTVSPRVQQLIDLMYDIPAVVLGRRMEVLAWNAAAEGVLNAAAMAGEAQGAARAVFLNPAASTVYLNWEAVASDIVAQLRLEAGRFPDDPVLVALIDELRMKSEPFRRRWAKGDVKPKTAGTTRIDHPLVGELNFAYDILHLASDAGQSIVTYAYEKNSATDERLHILLSWSNRKSDAIRLQ